MITPTLDQDRVTEAGHPAYLARVYAGVLGKLIGVYLGRPVENWSYDRIREEFGQIDYYAHEKRGRRLIVTDDDLSGTFTFLRAFEDNGFDPNLTSSQIGQTWLNYLIERTTILWWGGMGMSTEHTAYLRLKKGIPAPQSGSMELNTQIVAEQIGGQIFIDGWGLICPGNPSLAADYAQRAARVSHDGEAVLAARVIAALIAAAFVETSIDALLDAALEQIPSSSVIATMIADLRAWHARGEDWRATREKLERNYGYDRYKGNCHVVPNHGVIILSLLHGAGDFDRSMMIVNSCGWDTDCNSGNLGTILGVLNGLSGLDGKNWRGPVADRLYLPSADPGRAITDAVRETYAVVNAGRALAGQNPLVPKNGERFHFSLPGSVQGWQAESELANTGGALLLEAPVRASTPTFIPPHTKDMVTGYVLVANPTLYPGHEVVARLAADEDAEGSLFLGRYGPEDESLEVPGPRFSIPKGECREVRWLVPECEGYPIHEIGVRLDTGTARLESVDWQGVPEASFPPVAGTMWARAWGKALDRFEFVRDSYEFLTHNEGTGLLIQGHREWRDYRVEARLTPRMAISSGLAVRVQGLRRYVAFVFGAPGEIRIDRMLDERHCIARADFDWEKFTDYQVAIEAVGDTVSVWIDGRAVLEAKEEELQGGAFAFFVEEGCLGAGTPRVMPR
jgi:ADP-ribosylglycohydrolase